MKCILFTFLSFLCSVNISGQTFYYPDGKKIVTNDETIANVTKQITGSNRIHTESYFVDDEDKFTMVGYYLFTDKLMWVFTKHPELIKDIPSLSLSEYYSNEDGRFEIDLEMNIKDRLLTDSYILKVWGNPSKRNKYFDTNLEFEIWYYENKKLELTFYNGRVKSFILSN